MSEMKCPGCGGTGLRHRISVLGWTVSKRCPVCSGTGSVDVLVYRIAMSMPWYKRSSYLRKNFAAGGK